MRALLHCGKFASICWLGQAMVDMFLAAREYRQVLPQFSQGQEIGNNRLIPIAHLLAGLSFLTLENPLVDYVLLCWLATG